MPLQPLLDRRGPAAHRPGRRRTPTRRRPQLAGYFVGQVVGQMNQVKPAGRVVLEMVEEFIDADRARQRHDGVSARRGAGATRPRRRPGGRSAAARRRAPHAGAHLPDARRATGGEVLLKAECFQRTGSFKARGATNALAACGRRRDGSAGW